MKSIKQKIKSPKESLTIMTEVVCPNDTNPLGILQGGRLVQWMDIASAVCAQNHAEKICVTVSINTMQFKAPAKVGDIITIHAKMTKAFNTSMEIFVQAWAKKILSQKSYLINEAYFTFVAIDDYARPTEIPALKMRTVREKSDSLQAEKRKFERGEKS